MKAYHVGGLQEYWHTCPWKFTEDLIYLTKNTPQDDYLVLGIIDEPYTDEYDDDE